MNPEIAKSCKFSILIPAFKLQFLGDAIASVLAQTLPDFELIIVDDCSPEPIERVVRQFKDSRIRFFRNRQNCGAVDVVDNWNICLSHATGEYVICMGDDDRLLPDCLAEYDLLIKKYPGLDVYHGWTEIIDECSSVKELQEARPEYESVFSLIWHRWKGRIQYIGDFLYRRSFLESAGGFVKIPMAWGSDDMTSFFAAEKKGIANTQKPVFQYRKSASTISRSGNAVCKMAAVIIYEEMARRFLAEAQPKDDIEHIFHQMCLKEIDKYFIKKKVFEIKLDMMSSSIVKAGGRWLKLRKKHNISTQMIVMAAFEALKSARYKK